MLKFLCFIWHPLGRISPRQASTETLMQALEELQAKVKARANVAQALFDSLKPRVAVLLRGSYYTLGGARDTTSMEFTCA